jgi:uncharacterized membrane protein HdeD (DUF308 family)
MATDIQQALKDFRSLWWLFAVLGVLTIAAGIILILWPGPSLVTIAVIIGIFLLIDGIVDVVLAIVSKGEGRGLLAVLGVLSVIAGLICIKNPFSALAALVIIVGIWFVVAGVIRFIAAFSDHEQRGANIVIGILDIVAGIVVLAWPDLSLKALAVLTGIVFIIRGVAFVWAAFQVRKLPKDPMGFEVAPA